MRMRMPRRTNRLAAVLATALVVLVAAGSAGAEEQEDITLTPGGEATATSLGALTFAGRGFIEINLECNLTLEGMVTDFVNAPNVPVGLIEAGRAECEGATAELLFREGEKWLIELAREAEFLSSPTLAPLTLVLAEIEFDVLGVGCLYQGDISLSLPASGEPLETELLTITGSSIRKISGSGLCPTTGTLSGTLAFTQQAAQQRPLALVHNTSVSGYNFGAASGTREITFVNMSGSDKTVTRTDPTVRPEQSLIDITDYTCRGPRTLNDGNARPETSFCRVNVRYDRPMGWPARIHPLVNWIEVYGNPGGNTLLGRVIIKGL
jgi:hypothetical protein